MTHYNSISITSDESEYMFILLCGETNSATPYERPIICGIINKPIEAIANEDSLYDWDYMESDEINPFNVWNPNGTAIWTDTVDISYCYANITLEIKPLEVDGVRYNLVAVGVMSTFDVLSVTEGEDEEQIYTYVGSSVNKTFEAERVDGTESTYIATVPRIMGYSSNSKPDDYIFREGNYVIMIYADENENLSYKMQPITIEAYYEE